MANFIENLGLEFLTETEKDIASFLGVVAEHGKAITGYYGYPYINQHYGDAQFILRTKLNEEENIEITGLDTHCSGNCVWTARLSGVSITPENSEVTERRVILTRKDDGLGMVVINIVNADVLPSFLENDLVQLQMIAFPVSVNYFANEDEYADAQEPGKNGKKWVLADGSIFPSGFMLNHDPNRPEAEKNYELDDHVLIRSTVKKLYHGVVRFEEEEHNAFIRCIAETQYGDIEIVHTIDQVPEIQRNNLKLGAIVSGVFVLSGDAAIHEYENGFIRDLDHDFLILRYVFGNGEAERLRYIMAEDAEYLSEAAKKQLSGRDDIITHLLKVHNERKNEYFAHMATIVSVDSDEKEPVLPYGVGTLCIVLAEKEENNYESIVFLDTNQDGYISKITLSTNGRYHFKLDEQFIPVSPFDDVKIPESVLEPIIMRARFHGIIDDNILDSDVTENISDYHELEFNALQMLDALEVSSQPESENAYANIFGYLFAKAIERCGNEKKGGLLKRQLVANYSPEDAFDGIINTLLKPEEHKKIEEAMNLGKQFYKDFFFYIKDKELEDQEFKTEMIKSLVAVQRLGQVYAAKYLI